MCTLSDQNIQQINNIFQTLVEASEHFHQLIKQKELNQSIFILSSITEGFSAISNSLNNTGWAAEKNKIEKYLIEIVQLLEKGNFIKINEILQFSFLPVLKKTANGLSQEIDQQNQDKVYTIGVFSSFHNPREIYTKERIHSLIVESERQHTRLCFFTSTDVDFDKKEVIADVFENGNWQRLPLPFPDVINNVGAGRQSHAERKLRRIIPFTSFHVGNKYSLPKRMAKFRKYAELLVPFRVCQKESEIYAFLKHNNHVVFKYLMGNRGENIYFVEKKANKYVIKEHKKERIYSAEAFHKWLLSVVLKKQGSFIVQKYVHTRTKNDEPYHIRAHVQKNAEGKWVLTHIYPRVGNKKSNLSNVATDGKVEDLHTFLIQEYGEAGKKHEEIILRLSLELAHHLDKLHNLSLDELGIDLAIDENGRYWMHEANNGPQTAYHEEKRAINTIAYAKYIAKNGIAYSDSVRKSRSGMFNSQTSNLELVRLDNQTTIGILMGKIKGDSLAVAFAELAKEKQIHLFLFTPKDIDYEQMLIKGYFYEDDEWVPKVVEYPDVIFDRLKLRGHKNAEWIYEELEEVHFINQWPGIQHSRSEIYNKIQENTRLASIFSPFQKVNRTRDIFRYIEKYGDVLLKPEMRSATAGVQYVEPLPNGKYNLSRANSVQTYNELPLLNKFREQIKSSKLLVQKDPRGLDKDGKPFTIHTYLMLNEQGWKFVSLYAESQDFKDTKTLDQEELAQFLNTNYEDKNAEYLGSDIQEVSIQIAKLLRDVYGDTFREVSISFGVNEFKQLRLIDVDPSGPATVYDHTVYANSIIEQVEYVMSAT
ncbi:YheC/YheD family protein [Lentibacillus sediminis]|uniref:YheC/YheD family protein n=1 Tax=Lentibacillus sediminis TaxID=1940529 RepID=UPI000C1C6C60|nr:YheC/YheD family protein [Lentibacillus sediminis]